MRGHATIAADCVGRRRRVALTTVLQRLATHNAGMAGDSSTRLPRGRTQRVTRVDLDAGRVRVPVTTETKALLPSERTQIEVVLKGVPLGLRTYNPRLEGSHERSGVITLGAVLRNHVSENEVLPLAVNKAGVVYLGDRGSKLRIAQWVESKGAALDAELKRVARTLADFAGQTALEWRSPRLASDFRELSSDLWTELDLPAPDPVSDGFWPSRQPRWDAVAVVEGPHETRGVVLVEAKSHANELASSCTASSPVSRETIRRSLERAKSYLGVPETVDWMSGYYQAANRLAFLYYLRARRQIPTWLFFVHFLGDEFEVDGVPQRCPKSEDEWKPTLSEMHTRLGLPECHPFTHFARDVFLPA